MSMKTRGLILAAAAASLMLAGCATQGATDNTSTAQPAPAAETANTCKGMSSCKGNSCKAVSKKRAKKAAAKAADDATATTAQ
jgi:uncharacterized lipoprotein YajG